MCRRRSRAGARHIVPGWELLGGRRGATPGAGPVGMRSGAARASAGEKESRLSRRARGPARHLGQQRPSIVDFGPKIRWTDLRRKIVAPCKSTAWGNMGRGSAAADQPDAHQYTHPHEITSRSCRSKRETACKLKLGEIRSAQRPHLTQLIF